MEDNMSLRFKALRSSSNYNKTQFADLMQVAYRTVTNWEKKDGVIPSLSTISSIAKALHVPTYTVYDCFMNNPDSDPEENFFEFNKHDLTDGYRKSSLPGLLFKVMNTLHLFGGGIGHSYFCGQKECTEEWMKSVVYYDIIPMLQEYWFDDRQKVQRWENLLIGVFND